MRIIISVVAIIILAVNSIIGQQSYELNISSPAHQHIYDCIEDQLGNIYIVGDNAYIENSQLLSLCGMIYKINPYGQILLEQEFCLPDSLLSLVEMEIINDTVYTFGDSGSMQTNQKDMFEIYIMNLDLEILSHSKRKLFNNKNMGIAQHIVTSSEDIVILGGVVEEARLSESDIFFYKFKKNMDSIICVVDERENNQWGMDFVQDPWTKGYKVFGHGIYPNTVPSYDELIKFDSNFIFLSVDTLAWGLRSQHTFRWLTDSTYLLTGHKYYPYTYYTNVDIGVVKLNWEDELLDVASFGRPGDTVDYAGVKDNIDFVTKDNIFFGGTSNFKVNQWPWQTDDSWINLINLDSNLNVNWQRYYGGDAFYHLYGLLATQDGGCFMYACRYDENTQFQEYDIYILKVDANGLLTSVYDIPNIAANELFIYPNPATSRITVKFPGVSRSRNKELQVYNSFGARIMQINIPDGQEQIEVNFENLSPGIYYASIFTHGNRAATAKFCIFR